MSKTTAEILKKARKLIVEKGWVQGAYHDEQCGYCVSGAIDACDTNGQNFWTARRAIANVIGYGEFNGMGIPTWNDDPARSKKQVLEAFDRAISAELKTP